MDKAPTSPSFETGMLAYARSVQVTEGFFLQRHHRMLDFRSQSKSLRRASGDNPQKTKPRSPVKAIRSRWNMRWSRKGMMVLNCPFPFGLCRCHFARMRAATPRCTKLMCAWRRDTKQLGVTLSSLNSSHGTLPTLASHGGTVSNPT